MGVVVLVVVRGTSVSGDVLWRGRGIVRETLIRFLLVGFEEIVVTDSNDIFVEQWGSVGFVLS